MNLLEGITGGEFPVFCHGLALLLLGMATAGRHGEGACRLPWKWLALFGFVAGLCEWGGLVAAMGDPNGAWAVATRTLPLLSFVFLAEFGRSGLNANGGQAAGRWVLLPALALVLLGGITGMSGAFAAAGYALVLPGAGVASYVVLRQANQPAAIACPCTFSLF